MVASPQRWFGVGRSEVADPAAAGLAAARDALRGRSAALLVVFASPSHAVAGMAEAAHAAAGGSTPLIGCSTSGEFAGDGRGRGVVVLAFGGPGFDVAVRVVPDGTLGLRAAGATAASALDDVAREHQLVLLLADGRSEDQQEVVRGAYSVTGAGIPIVGGCAGDDMTQTSTRHFFSAGDGVRTLTNAVVAAAIGSDAPFGFGLAHGWVKTGRPMVVTRSDRSRIYELDGERAVDVYLRNTGGDPALLADPAAFLVFATVHPLGLSRRTGEDMRVIFGADEGQGFLAGLSDTPQDALVWFMKPDPAALRSAAAQAAAAAMAELDGDPLGVFVFDCCVRLLALGPEGSDAARSDLQDTLGAVPVGGFYTNGEILRTSGAKGMHQLTVVALALG